MIKILKQSSDIKCEIPLELIALSRTFKNNEFNNHIHSYLVWLLFCWLSFNIPDFPNVVQELLTKIYSLNALILFILLKEWLVLTV